MRLIQRRQFVVDPKFQYGFIFKFAVLETIVLIVSLVLLAYIINMFINISLPISVENGGVISFGAIPGISFSDEMRSVLAVMLLSVIVGATGMYIGGVSFSHGIVGPVKRLRNYINGLAHGDLDKKITLREKDYFQSLATDINDLRQQWHDSLLEMQNINKQLHEVANDEQRELLDRSSKIISGLYKKVS